MPGKLRMHVSTKYVGCAVEETVDLPDDWSTMTAAAQLDWVDQEWETFLGNNTDMSHRIEETE